MIDFLSMATVSDDARKLGINNLPSVAHMRNIKLVSLYLQQIAPLIGVYETKKARPHLAGKPKITSWYRNDVLNKAVGGSTFSRHRLGLAVDFIPDVSYSHADILHVLKGLSLPYLRKVIIYPERGHIHTAWYGVGEPHWMEPPDPEKGKDAVITHYLKKTDSGYERIG